MIKLKNITGKKLKLIDLDMKYLDDMYEYSSNPRMYEYFEFEAHKTKNETKSYLKKLIKRSNKKNAHWWFIQLKKSSKIIGSFGVHDIDRIKNSCEISYAISPKYWGKNVFSEVMEIVLDYLVNDLSFHRITATTARENIRSIKGIQKYNFVQEAILKDYYLNSDNKRYDAVILSLVQNKKINSKLDVSSKSPSFTNIEDKHISQIIKIKDKNSKFPNKELEHVLDVLGNNGTNFINKLEARFKKLFNQKYAIACNSGTSGLHASLAALDLEYGDEIIVPGLTVVMDAYAAIHLGATPVFADVDPKTFLITAESIKKKLTKKTKAVIVVSLQGLPVDIDPIMKLAKKYGFYVIEDNAQDFMGTYKNRISGCSGDVGIWSFENKKHLSGATEGGMICTNNKKLATKIRKFAGIGYKNMTATGGRTSLAISQVQDPNYKRFDTIGLNYRMPNIVAAVSLGQLESYKSIISRRQKVAAIFRKAIKGCNWLQEQNIPNNCTHTHYTFAVRYSGDKHFGLSWKSFYNKYLKLGGDGFYGACVCPHLEPSIQQYIKNSGYNKKISTPIAEKIQKEIMQFKTNYRDLEIAQQKANILKKLINSLNKP
jgi:perosamine synthetase|tara:strand:+ start:884 stop:2683 length:1800 start_codon:yes stop_codon:yes gene_type:complete